VTTPVGVAVVGAGFWGKNLVKNFAAIPGARLGWICDLDPGRLQSASELAPQARATMALADVLGDPGVEAVAVATPAEAHRDVSLACLAADKHLFVEKPLATCTADAEAIIAAADARRRTLMAGHLFLYDPAVQRCVELTNGGKAGSIRYITSVRTSMSGTARLDTNIAWDALIHDAYVMSAIVGRPPVRVLANGRGYLSELEDVAFATFDFDGGIVAQCYASWYALEKARKITVVGSDGILHLDEFATPKLAFYRRRYVPSGERDPKGRARWHWVDDGVEEQPVAEAQPLRAECEHFLDCVRSGSRPRTGGAEALQAVQIVEACQQSLAAGGRWTEVCGWTSPVR
jgi:predicted dehydrogenase